MLLSWFAGMYILFFFVPLDTFPRIVTQIPLYSFLGLSVLKTLLRQLPLKVTSYMVWYFLLFLLGVFSSLYAASTKHVFSALYLLFVTWLVTFAFAQYVQTKTDFQRIFIFFSYFPLFLVFYLLIYGISFDSEGRFGRELFGNANIIATFLMLSLCCVVWLLFYGNRKILPLNLMMFLVLLYITALTGGRKYILVPVVFFLLIMIFKNWETNRGGIVLYLLWFFVLLSAGIWSVLSIPTLYNTIGVRFEGLFDFFRGGPEEADASTLIRYMMIENGWKWFQFKPILGHGLNNFAYLFSNVLDDVYAHNNFIEMMVNLGLVGLMLYYAFYLYLIIKLFKIGNEHTGIRNFFLAYLLILLFFELGAVTYQHTQIHIMLALASAFLWLYEHGKFAPAGTQSGSFTNSTAG